jgi:arylsulfatase A-like enzyme
MKSMGTIGLSPETDAFGCPVVFAVSLMMKRLLVIALLFAVMPSFAMAEQTKPLNVVLVLVDDLGWMDLSCQGSDYYKTPNIDKLAEQGMRFTNAYAACSVCSPTRAAVMTGRWPARLGVTDWIRARFQRGVKTPEVNRTEYVGGARKKLLCPPNAFWMEHSEVTIAEMLEPAGYATCHIGKWHLGDPNWYPTKQGFDINIGGCDIGQPPSYFDPYFNKQYTFDDQIAPRNKGEFLTHREGDEAKQFITAHKEEPFFLFYCPYAVHTPIQAIPEVAAKYKQEGKRDINARYAALTESVDDAVGTIMETLEATGVADNTLVIFTSDNGGLKGPTDNSPLRSGKGYAYEGGIRVPLIVRWPGVVQPGTTSDEVVSSVDYMPTIREAIGKSVLPDDSTAEIDGKSLVSHLKSGGTESLDRQFVHWHFPHYRHPPGPYSIIRSGDWKLIRWYHGGHELYDLGKDLSEKNDLAESMPDKVKELDAMLTAELTRVGAKLPKPNPKYSGK